MWSQRENSAVLLQHILDKHIHKNKKGKFICDECEGEYISKIELWDHFCLEYKDDNEDNVSIVQVENSGEIVSEEDKHKNKLKDKEGRKKYVFCQTGRMSSVSARKYC